MSEGRERARRRWERQGGGQRGVREQEGGKDRGGSEGCPRMTGRVTRRHWQSSRVFGSVLRVSAVSSPVMVLDGGENAEVRYEHFEVDPQYVEDC